MSSSTPSMASSSSGSSVVQTQSGSSLSSQSFSTPSSSSSADHSSTPPASTSIVISATSASPTSSSTPTSTPQSSPAQTSSAAPQTTLLESSSPTNAASSSSPVAITPTITSTSTFTSQVATTISSTDASGSVVIITSTVPEVVTTSVSSSTGGGSSNNTGVIIGAVIGGVVGVILLAILIFCIRRRVRKDEFDGNFDPDRVVGHAEGGTLPQANLAEDITPFPQNQSYTGQGSANMRQFGKSPYIPVPSSHGTSEHASTEFYPHGAAGTSMSAIDAQSRTFMQPGAGPPPGAYVPQINMYGAGPVDWHSPRPGVSPPPSTVSNNTSSSRATKEREALGRSGQGTGLALATQHEAAEGSGDVVVHQDAGRAPIDEHPPPREIPPAYDSIRQD